MKYTIKELKDDSTASIIEKTDFSVEFTMAEILSHEAKMQKFLKELEANKLVDDAKCINIETNHEWVKGMSAEEIFTCHMYQESKNRLATYEPKIVEFKKLLDEYFNEKQEILNQTGITLPNVESTQ